MKYATRPLVNHKHGTKQAHVLAKSGNLYVPVGSTLIKLCDWLKSRCDMPDQVDEVFNPDVCEDWDVNFEYLTSKENMVCKLDSINFDCIHYDTDGCICGIYPDNIH